MSVLTTQASDASRLDAALERPTGLLVVCLCAAWCDACRAFRTTFERLAGSHATDAFVWLDVEDDSALAGDIEIENCPTLAVFRAGAPRFYGVTLPQEGTIARILEALARPDSREVDVPVEIAGLPGMLSEHVRRFAHSGAASRELS
jgi:thioredoxin reductase (NADPH)